MLNYKRRKKNKLPPEERDREKNIVVCVGALHGASTIGIQAACLWGQHHWYSSCLPVGVEVCARSLTPDSGAGRSEVDVFSRDDVAAAAATTALVSSV